MSYSLGRNDLIDLVAAAYDFADSTAAVVYMPGRPIKVRKIVGVITEASAGTSVVTVSRRNVDDTSSTTLGTFTVPAGLALNTTFKVDIIKPATSGTISPIDGSLVYDAQPGNPLVNPGQELAFVSDGGGSAGIANLYIEYDEQPNQFPSFNPADIAFVRA